MEWKDEVLYLSYMKCIHVCRGGTIVLNSTSGLGTDVGDACGDDAEKLPGAMNIPKEAYELTHFLYIGHEHNGIALCGEEKS